MRALLEAAREENRASEHLLPVVPMMVDSLKSADTVGGGAAGRSGPSRHPAAKPSVRVGGLPIGVTSEELMLAFESCGVVEKANVVPSTDFGFVLFRDEAAVAAALRLDGTALRSGTPPGGETARRSSELREAPQDPRRRSTKRSTPRRKGRRKDRLRPSPCLRPRAARPVWWARLRALVASVDWFREAVLPSRCS